MHCATRPSVGQAGSVEGTRRDPAASSFSILSHNILADRSISCSGKLILLALLRFARQREECFPAVGTLARAAGLSESTVRRHLGKLAAAGLISIRPTTGNPTGRVIVLDFARDPAQHPVRVSDGQGALGCQSAPPVRVSNRPDPLGCQTAGLVSPVEGKGENNSGSSFSGQRQRSEAAALQLDMIGTVKAAPPTRPTVPAAPPVEPITVERAQTVMRFVAKGGPLRDAALKHLTSDMLNFMRRSGGELEAFAVKHGAVLRQESIPPTNGIDRKPADDTRAAAVVEAASAITPGSHPRLVDRFADRMVSLLGDPRSRAYYCKIGHRIRAGNLSTAKLQAAIRDAGASTATNRAALFVASLKGN